jgi:CheY-like chemotaxis protein
VTGDDAPAAGRAKAQFLLNMGHELRTPLNAIIGLSETLLEDSRDLGRDDQLEPLARILRAARHLLHIVNDILDVTKLDAGTLELHPEPLSIPALVDDVVERVRPDAERNGNRIVVDHASGLGLVQADGTRLRQVLLNVLGNAGKFTRAGTITVGARSHREADRDWIVLAVSDTGIGIAPELMGELFADFTQADPSLTRRHGGAGLGLALSRRLCRAMGGDITVESAPGAGSTFTLRLPAAGPVAGRRPAPGAADGGGRPVPVGSPARRTVLVIDDDPTVRALMDGHLSGEGFAVALAAGGEEGLRRARELRPAAIVLDLMMPDPDGWMVLSALKGDPGLADIPVMLVTLLDERTRGYRLGAVDFLLKPIDRRRLTSLLQRVHGGGPSRRVLLVDDDDDARAVMRRGLEADGWSVAEAQHGRLALAHLAGARPDAIVLDLVMPEMDGFEFLAEVRRHPVWRDIPVVVVTAVDLTDDDHRRLQGGAERVIQMSAYDLDALLGEVGQWLAALPASG